MAISNADTVFKVAEINVLYTFDSKFWKLAAVSMLSLLKSKNSHTSCTVYCMVAPGTKGRRKMTKAARRFGGNVIWREVKNKENPFLSFDFKRWSPVIFYRLFAHRIFPDAGRMLYLDSDTLIYKDLSELFEMDMNGYVMAGAIDCALVDNINDHMGRYVREFKEKYIKRGQYINSGVLLINLSEKAELDRLAEPIDSAPLLCPDQDLINMRLDGKIKVISLRYNCTDSIPPESYDKADAEEAKRDYSVFHFYTRKPYIFTSGTRKLYADFMGHAKDLGWAQPDFLHDIKKYYDIKTHLGRLRLDGGKLKLFGITLFRL
jgi:lipopolysaccharide biosynthesis glycosyltransferase